MPKPISSLPIKALVRDPGTTHFNAPIVWRVADRNHTGYPNNSCTLLTDKIVRWISFDAKESPYGNASRAQYGNSNYAVSNLRQWLNKAGQPWYIDQHFHDQPPTAANVNGGYNPYYDVPGFLTGFSAGFRQALMSTRLRNQYMSIDVDPVPYIEDKVFLISGEEAGITGEYYVGYGSTLAMFAGGNIDRYVGYPTPQAVANSDVQGGMDPLSSVNWWLRAIGPEPGLDLAYILGASIVMTAPRAGQVHYRDGAFNAYGSAGLRPACNIPIDTLVSDEPDAYGVYTLLWEAPPPTTAATVDFQLTPIQTPEITDRIIVSLQGQYDPDFLQILATNNALDSTPVWEAITPGERHNFTNAAFTAANPAISARLVALPSSAFPRIYVNALSGTYGGGIPGGGSWGAQFLAILNRVANLEASVSNTAQALNP